MATSSIKLLQTLEFCRLFIFQRQTAFGNFNEPAISSANTVLQTLLSPPFRWPWNRVVTGFVCTPGQQDYVLFNWQPTVAVSVGYVLVDSNGNSQSVTTAGTTGGSIPTWNVTTGLTTTDGSAIWTNLGPIGLSNGSISYNFGWIEGASVKAQLPNDNRQVWKEISPKIWLGVDSARSRPHSISAQFLNETNGSVTFRIMPTPDQAYPVSITIQQPPPLFTKLDQTWSPVPDQYSHIYNWGLLSLLFMFADDPRFQFANQKFIAHLLSANQGLTDTERNIWLNNWQAVTGQQVSDALKMQQGIQGKGSL